MIVNKQRKRKFFVLDDHSTSQSETEGEEVEDNHIESNFSDYSIPHIDFDNGENDRKYSFVKKINNFT